MRMSYQAHVISIIRITLLVYVSLVLFVLFCKSENQWQIFTPETYEFSHRFCLGCRYIATVISVQMPVKYKDQLK